MKESKQINEYTRYAQKYNVSIAEAIADRDWPMERHTLIEVFQESTGRAPIESEIKTMRPDSFEQVREEESMWYDAQDFGS